MLSYLKRVSEYGVDSTSCRLDTGLGERPEPRRRVEDLRGERGLAERPESRHLKLGPHGGERGILLQVNQLVSRCFTQL